MTITLECRRCGHAYEVTPDDIRSGLWKRRECPVCLPAGDLDTACKQGYPMDDEQDAA